MIFYGIDKNGDDYMDRQEVANAFMPRERQYAEILNERGGFYGEEHDLAQIFQKNTRLALKNFFKGFVECEVNLEHIRQKVSNKCEISSRTAFEALDENERGYLIHDDFVRFLTKMNMYPAEKNLKLVIERFDKDENGVIDFDEFDASIKPVLSGVKDF